MHSLGVICCPRNSEDIKLARGFKKIFPICLRKYALEMTPVVYNTVAFEKLGLEVEEIQFPFLIEDKDRVSKTRFERALTRIRKVLYQKGISEIIIDKGTAESGLDEHLLSIEKSLRIFDGIGFYGVYIIEILKYICRKMGIKLQNIPVTLILDDVDDFFRNILKDLCTKVRFLSIISVNSENFIPLVNEIYSEIGLVVRLEKSIKSKKGDFGILINFSKNKDLVNSNRYSRNFVILNLGARISNDNINGILITDIIIKSKNKDIDKYYWTGKAAFCEALAYVLTGSESKDKTILLNKQKKILSGFKAVGYEIIGIKGCRGEIKTGILSDFGERIKPKIV